MAEKALPQGALVLVTGANGYIGSHVTVLLLNLGYRVRGTVRDDAKSNLIKDILRSRDLLDGFEAIIVPDMAADNAFTSCVEGCSGVVHVASDLSYNPDPNAVIPIVERGVLNALTAAAHTASVRRFVFTSSSVAAMHLEPNVRLRVDQSSWNEFDVQAAWAPPPHEVSRASAVYSASKVAGEKAAWKFMEENKPSFVLNTVLPSVNLGPLLSTKQPGSSAGLISGLRLGDPTATQVLREVMPPTYMVNVEDTARLHVAALLESDVSGERLFGFAEPINYSKIVRALQKVFGTDMEYPPPLENEGVDMSTVATERSVELLRRSGRPGFLGLEESLKAQFAS